MACFVIGVINVLRGDHHHVLDYDHYHLVHRELKPDDDDFFFLFDGCDYLIHFLVKINGHSVDVVALRFLSKQIDESLLLFLYVNGFGSLAHAPGGVGSESKEVTKNV